MHRKGTDFLWIFQFFVFILPKPASRPFYTPWCIDLLIVFEFAPLHNFLLLLVGFYISRIFVLLFSRKFIFNAPLLVARKKIFKIKLRC